MDKIAWSWESVASGTVRPFTAGFRSRKLHLRKRARYAAVASPQATSEVVKVGQDAEDRSRDSQGHGKLKDGKSSRRIVLNGSDSEGNVLQGQEDLHAANKTWREAAFPEYLQSEKDDFCIRYDEALQDAEREASTRQGKARRYMVTPENPIWQTIRKEASRDAAREPLLSSFLYASILSHDSFLDSLAFVLANRLSHPSMLATELFETFHTVFKENDMIVYSALEDLSAIRERDPSCNSYSNALLFYKGYHAIQVHRIAHHLWNMGLEVSARNLQSRVSEVFSMDIHPQAKFGRGILMDHGTGIVVGQTAEIGNNVSILQNVTLGGTGKTTGDRHPKICDNVLIGAAATVLGNIEVGKGSMIAAGSLVLKAVPPKAMVAGSPAQEIGKIQGNPALKMQHWLKTINIAWDPFDASFEAMMQDKSREQAQSTAQPETQHLHGAQPAEAQEDEEDYHSINAGFYQGGHRQDPVGHSSSKAREDSKASSSLVSDKAHSSDSTQPQDKDEEPVIGVRSDRKAQRLWPNPQEPEYYL